MWKKSNTRRSIYLFEHMQRRTCEHFSNEKLIKIQSGLKWTRIKRQAQLLHKRFLWFNESKSGNNRNKLNLFCLNCAKRYYDITVNDWIGKKERMKEWKRVSAFNTHPWFDINSEKTCCRIIAVRWREWATVISLWCCWALVQSEIKTSSTIKWFTQFDWTANTKTRYVTLRLICPRHCIRIAMSRKNAVSGRRVCEWQRRHVPTAAQKRNRTLSIRCLWHQNSTSDAERGSSGNGIPNNQMIRSESSISHQHE